MMNHDHEWIWTSDSVIRSPAHYYCSPWTPDWSIWSCIDAYQFIIMSPCLSNTYQLIIMLCYGWISVNHNVNLSYKPYQFIIMSPHMSVYHNVTLYYRCISVYHWMVGCTRLAVCQMVLITISSTSFLILLEHLSRRSEMSKSGRNHILYNLQSLINFKMWSNSWSLGI